MNWKPSAARWTTRASSASRTAPAIWIISKASRRLLQQRPDWSLFIGPEEKLFDALQLGGHGGVSGGANLFPKIYVQLCARPFASRRRRPRARHCKSKSSVSADSLYRIGKHPSTIIKGIKCALACLGVCNDFMAEPFHRFRVGGTRILIQTRLKEIETELSKLNL